MNEQIKFAGMILTDKKYFCKSTILPQAACGKEIKGFRDRASAREYIVSQLCQECQDLIFEENE